MIQLQTSCEIALKRLDLTSNSRSYCVRLRVPLNIRCSKKCAVPLLLDVSYRDPASIHNPIQADKPPNDSVTTLKR